MYTNITPHPTITFVTAFIELNEVRTSCKSVENYITYFNQLASSGIHICLYVSSSYEKYGLDLQTMFQNVKLIKIINNEDTEIYKLINANISALSSSPSLSSQSSPSSQSSQSPLQLPNLIINKNEYKDTINFISLMNTKFEFVYNASILNPFNTEYFAWIDFGICHIFKNTENTLLQLYTLSHTQLKKNTTNTNTNVYNNNILLMPGCWNKAYSDTQLQNIHTSINWRFCGGFFLGDKYSILKMYNATLEAIPLFIKQYSTIVWEVNIWAWIEHNMNTHVKIDWYEADHNDTILNIPTTYTSNISNTSNTDNTVFVLVSDENYYNKCKKTIIDLRACGKWFGDIVCITVGFNMNSDFKLFYNIIEVKFPEIDKITYLHNIGNGLSDGDGRELTKLTQWEKLHVFDEYFIKWDRVIYLDAGLRVLDTVNYLLELEYKDSFLCPGEYYKEEHFINNKFVCQLTTHNPTMLKQLTDTYGAEILNAHYFLNCIWIYDTAILKTIHKNELIDVMNTYPLFRTNEMGVMNLIIAMKYKLWVPFPTLASNGKYLFDWCELNRLGTIWQNYCLIKYPVTISFDDT